MSDVKAIRYLLVNSIDLTDVVPESRILAGVLPQGIALPAIAITHVSTVRQQFVADSAVHFCRSRVQVTVMAADYPTLKSTQALVRAALPRSRGTFNGVDVDSILPDTEGPDFTNETGMHIGSADFMVRFNE